MGPVHLVVRPRAKGFPMTIVRPGYTYADFALPTKIMALGFGLVERIIKREKVIFHDLEKTLWTLIHSEDFARGLSGLYGNKETQGQSYHIFCRNHSLHQGCVILKRCPPARVI